MDTKTKLKLVAMIIFTLSAFLSAFTLTEEVRLVIVLTLFFGGFGAGASLVSFIKDMKDKKRD